MLAGHDKVCVGEDELPRLPRRSSAARKTRPEDVLRPSEGRPGEPSNAMPRRTAGHLRGETLIEDNQKQQDAMTDFLAKQHREEAQIREVLKDNPTATTQQFDTFMSKQRNDQPDQLPAPSSTNSRRPRTRIDEFSSASRFEARGCRSLFEGQARRQDMDLPRARRVKTNIRCVASFLK